MNFLNQKRKPNWLDIELIAIDLTSALMGIDSERQLFRILLSETLSKIERSALIRRNYAKTFDGFKKRILSEIMALTVIQLINKQNNKNINNLKNLYCIMHHGLYKEKFYPLIAY